MSATIQKRVKDLIQNNTERSTNAQDWYNRYTTDELPINERKTPNYINTSESNIEEDQRLVNAYDSEIVDNRVNYVMANTPIFQYNDENETEKDFHQELLNNWIKEDGFIAKLKDLTEIAGATGSSSLALHVGEDTDGKTMISTKVLKPSEFVLEWSDSKAEVTGALRYWSKKELNSSPDEAETTNSSTTSTTTVYYGEFYDGKVMYNLKGDALLNMAVLNEVEDPIYNIPIIELKNTGERKPSFYKAISLINAYNGLVSDYTNEMAGLRHAILALTGHVLKAENDDEDDTQAAKRLKEIRMLFMEEHGKAEYITKEIQYQATEFILKQLEKNIERFTGHLNYADPDVYGRATNLAIKTRIKPLENKAKALIMELDETLDNLFKALGDYWSVQGVTSSFDWKKVEVIFTLDMPINDVEEADKLIKLSTIISEETNLSQASFIRDPKAEIEKLEKQRENESVDDDFNTIEEPKLEDTEK